MTAICESEESLLIPTAVLPEPAILAMEATMVTQPANLPSRIVLTGFMGAGKSTAGCLLAAQLGWRFIDADEEITRKAGMTVAEVFAKYGEFVFRRMETSAIAHALGMDHAVIALGGGAVEVLANRLLLEQTPRTTVVWLEADLPVLLDRCQRQADAATRPNLAVAEDRFRYRAPLYRRVANVRMETAPQTPEETVTALLQRLRLNSASS